MSKDTDLPNSPFSKFKWAFVYLLRLGETYKIGTTVNLRNRVKAINYELKRHGKPTVEVEHFFIAADGRKTESDLHSYFEDRRTDSETPQARHWHNQYMSNAQSEWFNLTPDEVSYIKTFGDEV